ncbi:MAG: ATP-binding cassette domain-containing protein [Acidimicrobiales bacterium]
MPATIWWVGGAVLAWPFLAAVLPSGLPLGVVLLGLVLGSLTGLTAIGLVLIYRGARVVNFAQSALGGVAGVIAIEMFSAWHWNYFVTLAVGLLVAGVVGAAVDRIVIQRFFWAPRLILTLATIGLAQIFGGSQLIIPKIFDQPLIVQAYRTSVSTEFTVFPILFTGDHVVIMVLVPMALGVLAWFLTRTELGSAIQASAENAERAMLLGIPVRRLSTIVWALAAVLSALQVMLTAPIQGLSPEVLSGPSLLLPALTAAVVARMASLPKALLAGMGLGVFQQAVFWNTSRAGITDVGFLVVILVALLAQRHKLSRADESALSSWVGASDMPPVPEELRHRPEVIWGRRGLIGAVMAVAVLVPLIMTDSQLLLLGTVAIVYSIVAISLVVLTGWAGQVSLGQFAIAGVGAVAAGQAFSRYDLDLLLALLAGAGAGALTAVVIGLPAIRIRGLFLAVTTLGFAVTMSSYFLNPTYFSSLLPQEIERPLLLGRWSLQDETVLYYLCLAVLVDIVALVWMMRRTRSGRVMVAVRDNEPAAQARGIAVGREKFIAFAISGALAGLAGALHVFVLNGVRFGSFSPQQSFEAFSMVVIGGLTSPGGAILGAVILRWAQYVMSGGLQLVVTGAGVLLLLLVFPGGLGNVALRIRRTALRLVADRAGIEVPSLIADRRVDADRGRAVREERTVAVDITERVVVDLTAPEPTRRVRPNPILRCENVDVSYGSVQVLFGVDLEVEEGEIVALLGTNGAGKSTLLRAVTGLTPASSGRVIFDGRDVAKMTPEERARQGIAMMPGGRGIFPGLSVRENLRLSAWLFRRDHDEVQAAIAESVELFPALGARLDEHAGLLSGGQQQMLSLAMVLIAKPKLLLIDELSLGLAPVVVGELLEVVKTLRGRGLTIVIVEQSVNIALELAERAVFMEKGEVRFTGATAQLVDRDDLLRSVFLEGAGAGRGRAPAGGDQPDLVASIGSLEDLVLTRAGGPDVVTDEGQSAIEAHYVGKLFGGLAAVNEVSLRIEPGEIVGILGPNGAGKTTLIDLLSGAVEPSHGRVFLGGRDVTESPADLRARLGLGRSFQGARLFPGLTVAETLLVAGERFATSRDPIAAAMGLPASLVSEQIMAERAEMLIELLGLTAFGDKYLSQVSTGTRRVIEIGCLLAQQPSVLLLDEPSAGIAQRESEALGPLLTRVRDATGAAMVIVEHDVPLLVAVCDRLIAMSLGEIIADGKPSSVIRDPGVVASYLGNSASAIARSGARRATKSTTRAKATTGAKANGATRTRAPRTAPLEAKQKTPTP